MPTTRCGRTSTSSALREERFAGLLADYAEPENLGDRLLAVERRNLETYGFGIKGFVLSMIETAVEVTEGRVPGTSWPASLRRDRRCCRIRLIFCRARRRAGCLERGATGWSSSPRATCSTRNARLPLPAWGSCFHAVEIVSDKRRLPMSAFSPGMVTARARAMMVGNSLKSDVVPAIGAGAWGVFVPHPLTWVLEHVEEPASHPRFRRIEALGELPPLIATLGID